MSYNDGSAYWRLRELGMDDTNARKKLGWTTSEMRQTTIERMHEQTRAEQSEIEAAAQLPNPDRDSRYSSLIGVLMEAVEQASTGKGHERHDNGKRFEEQPLLEICRMLGNPDFARGQVMKKTAESARLDPAAAVKELLGAINYAAAAIILIREQGK
jgi:hypothetical protein